MVEDSDDEVVLDSDDDLISEQKVGNCRGGLWRRASAVGPQSSGVWSSAGSNLTDKKSDNGSNLASVETHYEEALIVRPTEENLISNNENVAMPYQDQFIKQCNKFEGDEFVIFQAPCSTFENEVGVYYESQEPGEASQANALEFVDRYLSASVVSSSPEATIPKFVGMKSPLASCAKGSLNLAMKTNLMSKVGISTFEWDDKQLGHGEELFLNKKKELYNHKEKCLGAKIEDGLEGSVMFNSNEQFNVNEFDEQPKEILLIPPVENDTNERDALDLFGVGLDTQMAAEAIESLLYAPPRIIDANEDEGLEKKASKQCDSQTEGISYNQNNVTNSHEMSTFLDEHSKNQELMNVELLGTKNSTKGEPSTDKWKKLHDKSLKVFSRRKQMKKSAKEVQTFSPVACRTRKGSSVKLPKRTGGTYNLRNVTHGKLDHVHKRKLDDLDTTFSLENSKDSSKNDENFGQWKFDIWNWPKGKRTCRKMRPDVTLKSTSNTPSLVLEFGNEYSVVEPGETEGNFREASFLSNVKRKARSASICSSTALKKLVKGRSIQKSGQLSLADVTNTKCLSVSHIPSLGGENKMTDSLLKGKKLIKKTSTSPSLKNELSRSGFAEPFPDFISKDLRRRRSKVEIRVLFSQNLDDDVIKQQRKFMKKLGISMAKDCSDATHFVADRFARTRKMLETMAFGKPVVTPLWLQICEQAMSVIDEKNYILRDAKREKQFGFNMPISLSHARAHPLLKDRRVFITPQVKPDRELIGNLAKAVQGQVITDIQQASMEYNISNNLLILSCEQNYEACVPFLDKGAAVYSSELLLNGIIIQKLEYKRHRLFSDHVIMKRYTRLRKKNGN
uniref:uncharacterized protein LOC122609418 n=1 Tax=Erigeron canadensis TaxID=72917 RepID=UPI001CB98255|nr:uncharacterized protein LOC122609418 [Erigeron canadensis]